MTFPGTKQKRAIALIAKRCVILPLPLMCALLATSVCGAPLGRHVGALSKLSVAEPQLRNVLLLEQRSSRLGLSELYIHNKGAKFVSRNGALIAVCKAPEWRLVFFSKDRNLAYGCSYDIMSQRSLGLFTCPPLHKGQLSHRADKTLGLHTEIITIDGKLEPQGSNDSIIFQARERKKFASLCYVGADAIPLDPHVQVFVRWLFNLGSHKGIPLSFKKSFTNGTHETDYETLSVSRCDLPAAFFDYPTGVKMTSNLMDVEMVEDPSATLEDLFGGEH